MVKYILKRILYVVPVLLGVAFIVFFIISLMPGDPARLILGDNAPQESVEALRAQLGLNDPIFIRYINYIKNLVRGDLGVSFSTGKSVSGEIFSRLPVTATLAFLSVVLAISVGIPVGIISAVKQYSLMDNISVVMALFMASIPIFWLGLMMVLLFALQFGWFPTSGIAEGFKSYILPAVTLSTASMAMIIRMTRSTMLEVIRQDYIRTARSKGATERRVVLKHAIRNALIPVITVTGVEIGFLLGGTVTVESVFALPGLGTFLIDAIRRQDIPVVMGIVMYLASIFTFVNLIVDIIYSYVDPRIKAEYVK